MRRRVAVTGIGIVSPFGAGVQSIFAGLEAGQCALSPIPDGKKGANIDCHVAGLVPEIPVKISRETRRGMSPMSVFAFCAAREAIAMAHLEEERNMGVCLGSTLGSGQEFSVIFDALHKEGNLDHVKSMAFFKIMGHTSASNLALALKLERRILSPTSACSTGVQAIGLAYESIAFGRETRMLCGGTEEFSFLAPATFDKIGAASHALDPQTASLPFDIRRDGIVCAEGAGILCLEEMETARERGANILAEIRGFSTISSSGMALPQSDPARRCMLGAIEDAGISPDEIGYINAHATATLAGDKAEGQAIREIFGSSVPVGSLKGYIGHTLAASGAIESALCVEMMNKNFLVGHRSGFEPDPACGSLNFAETGAHLKKPYILKNGFALGGVYSSLVISNNMRTCFQ